MYTELLAEEVLLRPAIVGGGHSQVGIELLAELREELVIAQVLRERRQIVELARACRRRSGRDRNIARRAFCGDTSTDTDADGGREREHRPRERQAHGRLGALHEQGGRADLQRGVGPGRREQAETRLAPLLLVLAEGRRRHSRGLLISLPRQGRGHCWSPLTLL